MKNLSCLLLIQFCLVASCMAQYQAQLFPSSLPAFNYVDTPVYIGFTIQDDFADTIRSVSLSYTVNGGSPVKAAVQTFMSGANGGGPVTVAHPVPLVIHTPGSYVIHYSVDSFNHTLNTLLVLDSFSVVTRFITRSPLVHKRLVLEEFTGAWCPYCSGGAIDFETIVASDTDYIGVACHVANYSPLNDSMQVPEGVALHDTYSGYPSMMIDRAVFGVNGRNYGTSNRASISTIEPLAARRKKMACPANVSMTNFIYDSMTRSLSVDVNADFLSTLDAGDYRVNLTLTEDSVVNPHPGTGYAYGWDQNNDYFSRYGALVYDTIPVLLNLPAEIPDNGQVNGWAHRHVLRKMLGGPWGDTAVVPHNPTAGSSYTKHYSYVIPTSWNAAQVYLVAMVQEFHPINNNHQPANWSEPDHFINAVTKPLIHRRVATGVGETSDDLLIQVYPNPSNGNLKVVIPQTQETSIVKVYDLIGNEVGERQLQGGMNNINLDMSSGSYLLRITVAGSEQIRRIVIVR